MKKFIFALIIAFLSVPASAATYTVDDDGPADFNTIQAAIDFADHNDIIIVHQGTYTEDIEITKNLTLCSTDPNDPCIIADTIILYGRIIVDGYEHEINSFIISGLTVTQGHSSVLRNISPIIENCVFSEVFWESTIGAISCVDSSPTIRKCTFVDNYIWWGFVEDSHGAAISAVNSDLTIEDCNFIEDYATRGGAIYTENSVLTILHCNFSANGNSAVHAEHGSLNIENCTFIENLAGSGGAIRCFDTDNLTISNCTFTGNSTARSGNTKGGAICFRYCFSTIFDNCVFTENYALSSGGYSTKGGAIYFEDCYSTEVNNCVFNENYTYSSVTDIARGGAIYCAGYDSHPIITNCTFNKNCANGILAFGGAVYSEESYAVFDNCTFTENSTFKDPNYSSIYYFGGGALDIFMGTSEITNCKFTANSGWSGVGLNCMGANPKIKDCVFSGNKASDYGGALHFFGCFCSEQESISNCTFSGNLAPEGNALAFDSYNHNAPSNIGMTNCIFSDGGQEIWNNDGSTITISHTDLQGGQAACYDPCNAIVWSLGNIDADPCFVEPGYWDTNSTPTDANDDFWVDGDYHLKSQAWRWDSDRQRWDWDDVTSRCIDAGNPGSDLADEPLTIPDDPNNIWGHNLRINMGAYGGTAEASMAPYDWALLCDIDNSGIVDLKDFAWLSILWLNQDEGLFADFNRDLIVDSNDLDLFTEDWLSATTWH